MIVCPVCKLLIGFPTCQELRNHIKDHVSSGTPFRYPLKCLQQNCNTDFATRETYVKHVELKHGNALNVPRTRRDDSPVSSNGNIYDDMPRSPRLVDNCEMNNSIDEYNKELTDMLLIMFKSINIPHSYIEEIVRSFENFVKIIEKNIQEIIEKFQRDNVVQLEANPILVFSTCFLRSRISDEIDSAVSALGEINSSYKAKNKLYSHSLFVEPEAIPLGSRWETQLKNGDGLNNVLVKEEAHYISVIKTLRSLCQNPIFANEILDEKFDSASSGLYTDFKDGLTFLKHPLFSDRSKVSVRLQLNYDGMGSTNPLRGHSAPHNVGMFYFTIQNLPKHFQTCNENVYLLAICYSLDIKKYGFHAILSKFMEEIKLLETEGVSVNIPGRGDVTIFGSLSVFSGDCLAVNEIFGLVCDFSHDYHCSICYATKKELSTNFVESSFELRSKQQHAIDLDNLLKNSSLLHSRGVKNQCVLNRSLHFHSAENFSLDMMHIYTEGVGPYSLGNVLHVFINVRKLLTLDELNKRLIWLFTVLEVDKGNTPAQLNPIKEIGKGISPKLTANELACLIRYVGLILVDFIETTEDDEVWEFFLQLQTISDFVFAPKLNDAMLDYFTELYEEHLILFTKLWPELSIKPKQHYLVHFKTIVKHTGPPTYNSCMKYELRNNFFKRSTHTICNFKNIPKSLAQRNQLVALYNCIENKHVRSYCIKSHKLQTVLVTSLQGHAVIRERLVIGEHDVVKTSTKAVIFGRRYSTGNVVIVGKKHGILQFGHIQTIVWQNQQAYLLLKEMKTIGLDTAVGAFIVEHSVLDCNSIFALSAFHLVTVKELLDFHPLDICMPFSDHKMYIRLRYHVM